MVGASSTAMDHFNLRREGTAFWGSIQHLSGDAQFAVVEIYLRDPGVFSSSSTCSLLPFIYG